MVSGAAEAEVGDGVCVVVYVVLPSPLLRRTVVVRLPSELVATARSFVTRTVVVDTAVCAEAAEHTSDSAMARGNAFIVGPSRLGVGCDGRWAQRRSLVVCGFAPGLCLVRLCQLIADMSQNADGGRLKWRPTLLLWATELNKRGRG